MDAIVTRTPGLMSGAPCFAGTRILVQTLFDYLNGGYDIDEFLEQYPSLSREHVIEVLKQACEKTERDARLVE